MRHVLAHRHLTPCRTILVAVLYHADTAALDIVLLALFACTRACALLVPFPFAPCVDRFTDYRLLQQALNAGENASFIIKLKQHPVICYLL